VASGKLLLTLFIYLHERSGPRIREVETLSQISVNVYVIQINLGKLQEEAIIRSECEENKFTLGLGSWGGQNDPVSHDEKFSNERDGPVCSLKIIPPK
jgi:hypothetical protein